MYGIDNVINKCQMYLLLRFGRYVAGIARICSSSPKVVTFTLGNCIHVDMVSIPGDGLIL